MARKRLAAQPFTAEDWLSELAARYAPPRLEPGDLTVKAICDRLGISERGARRLMQSEADAGRAEIVRVAVGRGVLLALRKKKAAPGA